MSAFLRRTIPVFLIALGCLAVHLIPGGMPTAERAREILRECHININSPTNGVWLKGKNSPQEWAGPVHHGSHAYEYGEIISKRLDDAYTEGGKSGVENELRKIRNELFDESSRLFGLI
jgi:hypothetical protein